MPIDGRQGQFFCEVELSRSEGIKRDLLAGTIVIVDRYVYSGVAFTAAKVFNSLEKLSIGSRL